MKIFSFARVFVLVCVCSALAFGLSACYTQKIVIGNGAPTRQPTEMAANEETTKAWFFIFALIPGQGPIDASKMAKGASDYTIVYEENFLDGLIGAITLNLVTPRTVTVKR
jgi:Bor protein